MKFKLLETISSTNSLGGIAVSGGGRDQCLQKVDPGGGREPRHVDLNGSGGFG